MKTLAILILSLGCLTATAQDKNKIDFSDKWARDLDQYSGGTDILEEIKQHDLSSFWLSGSVSQNGVFGSDYWRIEFHLTDIEQDNADLLTYRVKGKDRHKKVVTPFEGTIRITKAIRYSEPHEMNEFLYPIRIVAEYKFTEDPSSKYSGVFTGTLRTDFVYTKKDPSTFYLDQEGDDGYMNNTFVGIWTSKSGKQKKCIWGLERLPYTGDWDEGAGEIYVNKKYVKNGWQSYMKHNELYVDKNNNVRQKDEWWK